MLTPSYDAVRRFQSQISKITTFEDLRKLLKASSDVDLYAHLESLIPWSTYWDIAEDSFVGNCELTLFPKLSIGGDLYEAPSKESIKPCSGLKKLDAQILAALKQSIQSVQRVWS